MRVSLEPERLRQIALVAAMAVPFGLLHMFVLAEICVAVTDILFLVDAVQRRHWGWARQPWFLLATAWWLWLVFCSAPLHYPGFGSDGAKGFVEAVVIMRLILFAAALQRWLLVTPPARRAAWIMLALSALWIGLESWQQYLTGTNIFGDPRWGDGALTGPFRKPRAGPLYAHLLFIAMLPPAFWLFGRPGRAGRAAGMALTLLGVATAVLIGQRMCVLLAGLGLVVTTCTMKRLRLPMAASLAVAVAVILATPIISPHTQAKLVDETQENLHHFSQSPYGQIFTVAIDMGLQSPWHGWGYRGYREDCAAPRFNVGLPALGVPPTQLALGACNLHPQNFYIQAFSDAGLPGLGLFSALMLLWTWLAASGVLRNPDPLRVGLFIGVLSYTWPLASTDEFPNLYMLGWFFFFLGFSLNCADRAVNSPLEDAGRTSQRPVAGYCTGEA
jgi:hypothetical protein